MCGKKRVEEPGDLVQFRAQVLRELGQDPAAPSGVGLISENPPTDDDVRRTRELTDKLGW